MLLPKPLISGESASFSLLLASAYYFFLKKIFLLLISKRERHQWWQIITDQQPSLFLPLGIEPVTWFGWDGTSTYWFIGWCFNYWATSAGLLFFEKNIFQFDKLKGYQVLIYFSGTFNDVEYFLKFIHFFFLWDLYHKIFLINILFFYFR